MLENKEVRFEQDIECAMVKHGWKSERFQEIGYDATLGLCPNKVLRFIHATQEKTWRQFEKTFGSSAVETFFKQLDKEIQSKGLLDIIRHGLKIRNYTFKLMEFKPSSSLNDMLLEHYRQNEFSLVRQFAYSAINHNTIDIVLMINGIPVVALELKNQYTNQNVEHAKRQLMKDRNPNEKVFGFNQRFLVYFALDHLSVAMTTKLAGDKTFFLPFNQGSEGAGRVGGAGNPCVDNGYPTAYLWEEVLVPDSLMDILQHFMNVQGDVLIFPRYHQLDVVRKLITTVAHESSGHNYLVQHSAGSGKSNSIAWLAYQLATLSMPNNEPLFSSVIVVTDRTVLDRQLQKTIMSFDHTPGFVNTIDDTKNSQDLKQAINNGNKVIITTLQKFPVIYDEVDDMSGRRFAVIVDEAHSSQSGKSAKQLKQALGDGKQAKAEYESFVEEEIDAEDVLVNELMYQGKQENLSFFAFTATPKKKTLELFGTKDENGSYQPFHIYSMRQAIEEGFILDVLNNYMTYEESYRISRRISDNPDLSEKEAKRAIAEFKALHPHVVTSKSKIIVDNIQQNTIHKIDGHGKAMLVTSSRKQAVAYMKAISKLVQERGYTWRPLVAFSGAVEDGDDEYTEESMNRTINDEPIKEEQLKEIFHQDPYRLLIVAEKYQTGFDEPLLHTMFVDKKLRDVKAVQTLSRLNRTTKGKVDTFVLDFANDLEDIEEAFQPYYECTTLEKGVDIQMIYDLQETLHATNVYTQSDIDKVDDILCHTLSNNQDEQLLGRLSSVYQAVMQRYYTELDEDQQANFRKNTRNFVKWYEYISQINRTFDMEMLKEKNFVEQLIRFFPTQLNERINIANKIALDYYRLKKEHESSISLANEEGVLYNPTSVESATVASQDDKAPLDDIIDQINAKFPNDFTPDDRVGIEYLEDFFVQKTPKSLENYAQNNSREMFDRRFNDEFSNKLMEVYFENVNYYQKLMENQDFLTTVTQIIGQKVWEKARG